MYYHAKITNIILLIVESLEVPKHMTGWMKRAVEIYIQLTDIHRQQLAKMQECVVILNTFMKSLLKTLHEEQLVLNKSLSLQTRKQAMKRKERKIQKIETEYQKALKKNDLLTYSGVIMQDIKNQCMAKGINPKMFRELHLPSPKIQINQSYERRTQNARKGIQNSKTQHSNYSNNYKSTSYSSYNTS